MKILFGCCLAALLVMGCKKDNSPSNSILLSKVYTNGLLTYHYSYNLDRKPSRRDNFAVNSGQSVAAGFRFYEYNDEGLLTAVTDFNKNNAFVNKYTLQYDLDNRVTRLNDLAADNSLQFYYLFKYGNDGKLSQYSLYNNITSKKTLEGAFTYSGEDVTKVIRTSYLNPVPGLYDSTTFSYTGIHFPSNWNYFELLPVVALPIGDNLFYEMIFKSYYRYYVDAPPVKSTVTFTEQVYNNAGLPTKLRISFETTYITTTTNSNEITYEYLQ